jgi:putative transposase
MKRKFSESQILAAIKKQESGVPVKDLCRELEIHPATFYNWKAKYGGMDAAEIKRNKELENDYSRLKRMYAELSMEHHALKEFVSKKL